MTENLNFWSCDLEKNADSAIIVEKALISETVRARAKWTIGNWQLNNITLPIILLKNIISIFQREDQLLLNIKRKQTTSDFPTPKPSKKQFLVIPLCQYQINAINKI